MNLTARPVVYPRGGFPSPMKSPVYAFYRKAPRSKRFVVIQLRGVFDGALVDANDLEAYLVLSAVSTGFFNITVGKGSTMFLTQDAAQLMLKYGTIERIMSETLVHWRDGKKADLAGRTGNGRNGS